MLNVVDKIINKTNHKFEFIDLGGGWELLTMKS